MLENSWDRFASPSCRLYHREVGIHTIPIRLYFYNIRQKGKGFSKKRIGAILRHLLCQGEHSREKVRPTIQSDGRQYPAATIPNRSVHIRKGDR